MIYTNQTKYNLFFACTIVVCLLIDLGQFFLIGTTIVPFLLCMYCTLLLPACSTSFLLHQGYRGHNKSYAKHNKTSPFVRTSSFAPLLKNRLKYMSKDKLGGWRHLYLGIIALLQCLEFFCFYNFFSLACIFLIPTTALAVFLNKNLYPSIANIITLVLTSSLIQIYAAEAYLLPILPTIPYTIIRISATLLTAICFSLTINIWGMQDNRA